MIASRRWQDWATTVIGALVALSPLVFTTTWKEPAAGAAYILGALIFIVGVLTLVLPEAMWLELAQVVLAAVLFFSPWLIAFTAMTGMAWTAWIGAVALVLVLGSTFLAGRPAVAHTA